MYIYDNNIISNPIPVAFSRKTIKGKLTKAIHMDASPFILPCLFDGNTDLLAVFSQLSASAGKLVNLLCHWSLITIALKSTPKWPGWSWDCPMACRLEWKRLLSKTIQPSFCSYMADGLNHHNDEKSTSVARILGGGQRTLTKLASNMTRSIFSITSWQVLCQPLT